MNSKYLSQDELQHIEHANKILTEHLELVRTVVNETEGMLNTYVPILKTYVLNIAEIRNEFGKEVGHIIASTREINIVTNNTQPLINFIQAVVKLNEILTPEIVEKLNRLGGK